MAELRTRSRVHWAKVALGAAGDGAHLRSARKFRVPPTLLADYARTYKLTPTINNVVSVKDGHLVSKLGNQPEVQLFAESDTKFFLKVVDAQVEFFDPLTHDCNSSHPLSVWHQTYEAKKLP